jgi:sterol desaturase/sphingolipid hydroxylase (fatty acid hydroxylase superfamily)
LIALAVLAALQMLWPAERDKRRPSGAVAEDAAWFLFSTLLAVTILGACLAPLNMAYRHVAGGRTFDLTPRLGVWGVALLAFVIADLLGWYAHWLHHRVATLWYFHAVHHSQANLNVLSDSREHFLETVVNAAIAYLPARALGLNSADSLRLASLTIYWSALIHTNLRTNLGPLRYVLVSPQAHRVHHSIDPEHYDTNFGTFFIFWDMLFRTAYPSYDIYPATGIEDIAFPELARRESGRFTPVAPVTLWVKQTIYPFRVAVQRGSDYAGNVMTRPKRAKAGVSASIGIADPFAARPPLRFEPRRRRHQPSPVVLDIREDAIAASETNVALALQEVVDKCEMVTDRIDAHGRERHELTEAIARLSRPVGEPGAQSGIEGSMMHHDGRAARPTTSNSRPDGGVLARAQRLRKRAERAGRRLWTRTRP